MQDGFVFVECMTGVGNKVSHLVISTELQPLGWDVCNYLNMNR